MSVTDNWCAIVLILMLISHQYHALIWSFIEYTYALLLTAPRIVCQVFTVLAVDGQWAFTRVEVLILWTRRAVYTR